VKKVVVTGCPRAYGLRSVLSELGVEYVDYHSYQEAGP
jgi:hypothetical protein